MFKQLIGRFRPESGLEEVEQYFNEMLTLAQSMVLDASGVFWGRQQTPEERSAVYETDVRVNKLERRIRKRLIAHLSATNPSQVNKALLIMSVVKDVERIGDYAKNLIEVVDIAGGPFPEDQVVAEFRAIRRAVEKLSRDALDAWKSADSERAVELTVEGRSIAKRCDAVLQKIARTEYKAPMAVALTLASRFYKRICGHFLNLLSGLIMPLHKLDYFDETALADSQS